ncbi:MAG: hypothetical protein J6J36_02490 [Clostridia bacterium]|nr:hypothetical protein [Clostridia bacterium]
MIDMHIHSTNSDGSKTVTEILEMAQKQCLNTISFTDHESCNAYDELEKIDVSRYYSGKIIKGVELKSQHKDLVMDILAYGFDCQKMKEGIAECYKNLTRASIQEKQIKEFYEIGRNLNLNLRPIEELQWDKNKEWGSIVFYNEMKSHIENKDKLASDIWESFSNFKNNHYHIKGDKFYINRANNYPNIKKIIDVIHKSGGKAFIAHIFEYREIKDKIAELEEMVSKYDIDGIECYYTNFTDEEHKEVLKFAKDHNLLISGGSDYHGDFKPGINLGIGKGSLNVPDSVIENWEI